LGTLASGASQTFTIVTVPTNCPTVSVEANVTSTTADLVLANNTATGSSSVQDIAASLLQLTIRRVSLNNNHVEITWPQSCAPYQLEGTFDLNSPILWTPMLAPVQILNSRYSTVIPAADPHQFFRLKSQ
jgi:hypothetical protein